MKTNAPKANVWIISLVLGLLGVVGNHVDIPILSSVSQYLVYGGFALLLLSNKVKGL